MGKSDGAADDDLAALTRIMKRLEGEQKPPDNPKDPTEPARLAGIVFEQRRQRAALFAEIADLLVEPAWDILLNLFVAPDERAVPASSAAQGAGVPHATVLRYLNILEARGLICSEFDASDRRRRCVRLTPNTRERLNRHFAETPLRSE